jgi:phosphoenolpyruvate synthase/pyruvate phosphate dikinase
VLTADKFWEFVLQARRVNLIWYLGAEQFSEAAQARLEEVAREEGFPVEQLAAIVPKFETPLSEQHKEVQLLKKEVGEKTLAEVREDAQLFARLEEHTKKFAWIEIANYAGEPLTVEKLYEQIMNVGEDSHEEGGNTHAPVSERLSLYAHFLSQCGYMRQAGAEHYAILTQKVQPYLKAVGEKFGLTYAEFLLQRDTEIFAALRGELSPAELKENAKRREASKYVFFAGKGDEILFTEEPEDIVILTETMLPKVEKNIRELQGQIGNKGVYTGTVRVIMNLEDFGKMQPGDVLVSTMTTPDFVVLMNQSGAIVTDIGGMLCHAAIVSRELNKPCVIGTKFATQALKDGDMVEVNAEEGIVKIL